jgi:hypothetical protein
LGEKTAGLIDDEEAAVAYQAEGVDFGAGDGAAAEGFDWIEEEAGEVHGGRVAEERGECRRGEGSKGRYAVNLRTRPPEGGIRNLKAS